MTSQEIKYHNRFTSIIKYYYQVITPVLLVVNLNIVQQDMEQRLHRQLDK